MITSSRIQPVDYDDSNTNCTILFNRDETMTKEVSNKILRRLFKLKKAWGECSPARTPEEWEKYFDEYDSSMKDIVLENKYDALDY